MIRSPTAMPARSAGEFGTMADTIGRLSALVLLMIWLEVPLPLALAAILSGFLWSMLLSICGSLPVE